MRVQCIDLPPDSAPAAGPPTTAYEQSISLRCLWGQPRPLFACFRSFQTYNTIFTTNQCEKMSKCPSSIWHQDSNPQPFEHESSTITTMQGLSMLFLNVLPSSSCSHSFKGGKCVTFSTEQIIDIQIENRLPIG